MKRWTLKDIGRANLALADAPTDLPAALDHLVRGPFGEIAIKMGG